jgi:ribosomal protein S12 methylthiotransferase accessory factor
MAFDRLQAYESPEMVTTFDDHALYYSANASEWAKVPFMQSIETHPLPDSPNHSMNSRTRVENGVATLAAHNLSVLVVELSIPEVLDVGVHVSRVLVPGLVSVHPDHRWPYIGGTAPLVNLRFPNLKPHTTFPNPFPHPLG